MTTAVREKILTALRTGRAFIEHELEQRQTALIDSDEDDEDGLQQYIGDAEDCLKCVQEAIVAMHAGSGTHFYTLCQTCAADLKATRHGEPDTTLCRACGWVYESTHLATYAVSCNLGRKRKKREVKS